MFVERSGLSLCQASRGEEACMLACLPCLVVCVYIHSPSSQKAHKVFKIVNRQALKNGQDWIENAYTMDQQSPTLQKHLKPGHHMGDPFFVLVLNLMMFFFHLGGEKRHHQIRHEHNKKDRYSMVSTLLHKQADIQPR